MAVQGASLQPIYSRLNAVEEENPGSAVTFSDWSMQAGDTVTITRDGKEYKSTVHSSTLVWKGKTPTVTINSNGEEHHKSVANKSKDKFSRGGSGLRASENAYWDMVTSYNNMTSGLILASSSAALYVDNKYTQMSSGLKLTSSSAALYVDNKYTQMSSGLKLTSSSAALYVDNKYTQMSSGLKLTSSSAALYVDNKYTQMSSGLKLTSSSAALYVDNKYTQMSSGLKLTSSSAALYVDNKYTQMSSGLKLTSSSAALYVDNKYTQMSSGLKLTSSSAALYVDNKYTQMSSGLSLSSSSAALYVDNKYTQMSSGLKLTSSSAALYVDNKYTQMTSGLKLTSSSAALYVDNKYTQMTAGLRLSSSSAALYASSAENAAEIVARINASTGQSEIQLDAQKVYIGNQRSTTVINGKLEAEDITSDLITTKLALASNVNAKKLTLTNNGYIVLPTGDGTISITGSTAVDIIRGLKVVSAGNNNYNLQAITYGDSSWHDLPNSTFSRAVTGWTWAGGDGQVKVTAQPQNQTLGVDVRVDGDTTISSNGSYTYKVQYEDNNGSYWDTGATLPVNVSISTSPTAEISNNGSTEPTGVSNMGDLGTITPAYNPNWCIVTAKAGSNSKPYKLKLDGSTIYDSGKTQGMYNFYHSDQWSGHWTGDGTHGSTSGKHYVTGPNVTNTDWEVYYCIEDEATSAGLHFESHTHSGTLAKAITGYSQDEAVYYGKLYFWNPLVSNYSAVISTNKYWFYSDSNIGNRNVYW